MPPPPVRHRVQSGQAGDRASAVGADVALLVHHHVVGPVLARTTEPAVASAGCAAIGHPKQVPLTGFVALGAMFGSTASLRPGARVMTGVLTRAKAERNAGIAPTRHYGTAVATAIRFAHALPVASHADTVSSHVGEARRQPTEHLDELHAATGGGPDDPAQRRFPSGRGVRAGVSSRRIGHSAAVGG